MFISTFEVSVCTCPRNSRHVYDPGVLYRNFSRLQLRTQYEYNVIRVFRDSTYAREPGGLHFGD